MRGRDAEGHRGARASIAPIVGHVGDGNFHTSPVFDRNNPKEMAAIEAFLERLAERAIAMEGTCTGEHGVGQGKRKYLKAELGDGLAVMRAIKTALDPLDILNPGKIFSACVSCARFPLPILLQNGESDCLGSQVLWHE